jgi:twitching motility protein PilT
MIDKYLGILMGKKGSDLHMKVGNVPVIRINGELFRLEEENRLSFDDMNKVVEELLPNEKRREDLKNELSTDFSYSVSGLGRFRINISLTSINAKINM